MSSTAMEKLPLGISTKVTIQPCNPVEANIVSLNLCNFVFDSTRRWDFFLIESETAPSTGAFVAIVFLSEFVAGTIMSRLIEIDWEPIDEFSKQ
jgi:hypothetical protein